MGLSFSNDRPLGKSRSPDSRWMGFALQQGYKALGTTSPNPPVGAVIVSRGRIIGQGYHHCAGQPHAERMALADAREKGNASELPGSTLYVTLEPCSSQGRTPPCTEGIIEAGIGRVVYGAIDPDERHQGRANAILTAAGIEVASGVEQEACMRLLRPWVYSVRHKRPWIVAKVAASLDGRMARKNDRWLSSSEALRYAHDLRLQSDAVLTGGRTVRMDNPSFTIRCPHGEIPPEKRQPWRIVLTNQEETLPKDAALFSDKFCDRTIVMTNVKDLSSMLHKLYTEYGVIQLLLECGGNLLRSFLEKELINEWVQNVTPYLCGGGEQVIPGCFLPRENRLEETRMIYCGSDWIVKGILTSSTDESSS